MIGDNVDAEMRGLMMKGVTIRAGGLDNAIEI